MSVHKHVRPVREDMAYVRGRDYVLVRRYGPGYVRHWRCVICGKPIGLRSSEVPVPVAAIIAPQPEIDTDPGPVPGEEML